MDKTADDVVLQNFDEVLVDCRDGSMSLTLYAGGEAFCHWHFPKAPGKWRVKAVPTSPAHPSPQLDAIMYLSERGS